MHEIKYYYHIDDPLKFYALWGPGLHKEKDDSWSDVVFYMQLGSGKMFSTYPERWEERFKKVGQV